MSIPAIPAPSMLVLSCICSQSFFEGPSDHLQKLQNLFEKEFGQIWYQSPCLDFNRTTYYEPEMGKGLKRYFFGFETLVARNRLAGIKLRTNELEREFLAEDQKRQVNLDPGLLSMENLILATGKNFTHRVYLHSGIFAEVTMIYQKENFQTLPWTYPDYSSEPILGILHKLRLQLKAQLQKGK